MATAYESASYDSWEFPALPKGTTYVSVASGAAHTILVRSDGLAIALGSNSDGQCTVPGPPAGVTYVAAGAGDYYSMLIRSDRRAVVFGSVTCLCDLPSLPEGVFYNAVSLSDFRITLLQSDGHATSCNFDRHPQQLRLFARSRSFSTNTLLDTGLVRSLTRCRMYTWALLSAMAATFALQVFAQYQITEEVPVNILDGSSERAMAYRRPLATAEVIICLINCFALFLAGHRIMTSVFLHVVFGFESLVVILSASVAVFITLYKDFRLGSLAGDTVGGFVIKALMPLMAISWIVVVVCIDASRTNRMTKLSILLLVDVYLLYMYYQVRFVRADMWFRDELCWFTHCATDHGVILSSIAQIVLFLSKLMTKIALGKDFCILRPDYKLLASAHSTVYSYRLVDRNASAVASARDPCKQAELLDVKRSAVVASDESEWGEVIRI